MTSQTGKLTINNDSTSEQMHKLDPGTEQCELPEKTHQIGSQCFDNEKGVLGTVLSSSVVDEKSNQVSDNMTGNSVIQPPALPQYDSEKSCQTGKLTINNDSTSEQMQKLDPETEQCELSEKTHQIGSQCFDNEQRVLDTVSTSSVVDEKSNQVSDNMTGNSVIQPPAPPQYDSEKSCQTGKLTINNDSASEQMQKLDLGTEQCELSEKTHQSGSECFDKEQRVLGTVLTSSVVDEKSNQVSDNMTENSVIQLPAPPQTGKLTISNDSTSKRMQDLDPGTEQCELIKKTHQIGSQCFDNKQRVLHTVLTSPIVDEKSNQVSDNMTGNSVIQPPAPSQYDSEKSCQTGKLTINNDSNSEQMQKLASETEQCELSEKTHQIGAECFENEQRVLHTVSTSSVVDEKSNQVSGNMTGNSVIHLPAPPQYDLEKSYQTGKGSCLQQSTLDQVSGYLSNDKSENKCQLTSQNVRNEPVEVSDAVTILLVDDQTQSVPAQANVSSANELLDPPSGDVVKNISSDSFERKSKTATHMQLGHKPRKEKRTPKLLKKKYMLRSLGSSDRALRSRTQEKPKTPVSNSNLVDANNDGEKGRRGRKKKRRRRGVMIDDFARIRARLRYLLNRISYEQSLIDAYSGEGWKGYSMEKLKPEKELQRAKTEILRRKLKIRDLFRNLDSLCAEGRLPASLFDSEGEICSEDIFCAKCGSKDLSIDNDIILCDGACDRGFHQFCLDPPLLTENIPPGDDVWLCPGCECKDDCMELLNKSLGTSLSISDTWERVFPEVAAAAGNNVDYNLGLPSDDYDDDDYSPDVPEDQEVEGGETGESSSDESEYASASEKLEDSHSEDQYIGLPSEDSEDDDYDPNALDLDRRVTEESSTSDFTSDSEDFAAAIKDNTSSGQDELLSLLDPDPGQEVSAPVSGKRFVEKLDYKKLYDETYPNSHSDTSDDEDWTSTATPSRKMKFTGKAASVSPNGKASILELKETTHAPRRNTRQNKVENTNNLPIKSLEGSEKSSSSNKRPRYSTYRRLGEDVVQRLYKSFKENQYPDRTIKESLAQELGLTFQQVSKWFGNSRWSFRNSSHTEISRGRNASQQAADSRAENRGALGAQERDFNLVSQEGGGQKSKTPSSRKRKHMSEPQASEAHPDVDGAATVPPAGSPRTHEEQTGHKMRTRKRK